MLRITMNSRGFAYFYLQDVWGVRVAIWTPYGHRQKVYIPRGARDAMTHLDAE